MVQDAVMHATLDVPVAIIAVTKVGVEDIRYFPARGLEETLPLETTYANRASTNAVVSPGSGLDAAGVIMGW